MDSTESPASDEGRNRTLSLPRSAAGLALALACCYAAAAFGSRFRPGAWYEALAKPAWTPPDVLFPVVWSVLYTLMGVAAWLVWRNSGLRGARGALALFAAQLAANALWSWIFFGMHRMGLALADILLLWVLILATTVAFWRHSRVATWMMAPHLIWVGYAAALNTSLYMANR